MKNKLNILTWLFIIIILAAVSLWKLGSIPRGFEGDEAAIGYYAYSLLHQGTDEFGTKWPVYFKSIGDYKYPGYSYLSILPVAVFGLNEFSTRFISAISGILAIVLLIKFVQREESLNKYRSLVYILGTIIAVFSPWFLLFSRQAREANVGLALTIGGVYLLTQKKSLVYFLGGVGLFLIANMTYPAYRVLDAALLVGMLVFIDLKHIKKNIKWIVGLLIAAGIILALSLDPLSRIRAGSLLLTTDRSLWDSQQSQINEVGLAIPGRAGLILTRAFDNKFVTISINFITRYVSHFDLTYLFISGNPNLPWYSVPFTGLLLIISLPLIFFGLIKVIKNLFKNRFYAYIFWWLIISPVSSSLTVESPNPIRNLATFPVFIILIFIGIGELMQYKNKIKWVFISFISLFVIVNAVYSAKQYFIHREYHRPWYTDQGKKEIVDFVLNNYDKYPHFVMTEDPYIFFMFYGAQRGISYPLKTIDRQWNSVASWGKVSFLMDVNCPKVGKLNVVYLCKGPEVPQNSKVLFVSRFSDGIPAYTAVEFIPVSEMAKNLPALPDRLNYMVETDNRNDGLIPESDNRLW